MNRTSTWQNFLHESSLHLSYSSINFINTPYYLGRNSCVFPASIYENIIFIKCSPIFKFPYIFMFFPWTLCLWTFSRNIIFRDILFRVRIALGYIFRHILSDTFCLAIFCPRQCHVFWNREMIEDAWTGMGSGIKKKGESQLGNSW